MYSFQYGEAAGGVEGFIKGIVKVSTGDYDSIEQKNPKRKN